MVPQLRCVSRIPEIPNAVVAAVSVFVVNGVSRICPVAPLPNQLMQHPRFNYAVNAD